MPVPLWMVHHTASKPQPGRELQSQVLASLFHPRRRWPIGRSTRLGERQRRRLQPQLKVRFTCASAVWSAAPHRAVACAGEAPQVILQQFGERQRIVIRCALSCSGARSGPEAQHAPRRIALGRQGCSRHGIRRRAPVHAMTIDKLLSMGRAIAGALEACGSSVTCRQTTRRARVIPLARALSRTPSADGRRNTEILLRRHTMRHPLGQAPTPAQ